MTLDEWVI